MQFFTLFAKKKFWTRNIRYIFERKRRRGFELKGHGVKLMELYFSHCGQARNSLASKFLFREIKHLRTSLVKTLLSRIFFKKMWERISRFSNNFFCKNFVNLMLSLMNYNFTIEIDFTKYSLFKWEYIFIFPHCGGQKKCTYRWHLI